MAVDEKDFARTIVHLMRMIIDLQTTVTALGLVLKDRDPTTEQQVGAHRAALLQRAAPLLARFEQAEAADLLAMLRAFAGSGPIH